MERLSEPMAFSRTPSSARSAKGPPVEHNPPTIPARKRRTAFIRIFSLLLIEDLTASGGPWRSPEVTPSDGSTPQRGTYQSETPALKIPGSFLGTSLLLPGEHPFHELDTLFRDLFVVLEQR